MKFASTNQKHYPDLDSDASSVWNFCARFSDVTSRGTRWWRREMSAVFSGYNLANENTSAGCKESQFYSLPFGQAVATTSCKST